MAVLHRQVVLLSHSNLIEGQLGTTSLTRRRPFSSVKALMVVLLLLGGALLIVPQQDWRRSLLPNARPGEIAPLAMEGGDPYVRALLRTISASESNDPSPYTVMYGGKHFSDLSRHPDQCRTIVSGPNRGNCTTAAGRYQFITTTWEEKATLYHPNPEGMLFWKRYSYEAFYQDQVAYNWLIDAEAWGIDIQQLLREGEIRTVLQRLSGTWTSLGYGIEDNWFTPALPRIYQELLQEELERAKGTVEESPV
ncbi:glycoside hydrolase family 24 protein [Lyngbya confervoides]|uniref:Glycoside hydrolase family protein n=1 Tax=Lyngbya confervoides BDU141951 TaxID=1574623 RepID=A0ABD4T0P7_9CYAN|nr:glycoside hydrolase family protein [Lyngbya confervoides]MCM1982203.1 glycoside hydrolase family protein [Lyngbya confervoides BDU141951]